jgi:glycosyltransferase involved in cell wall biosynthesis
VSTDGEDRPAVRVAHLTTVDSSLRFLLFPQLAAVVDAGGEAIGISAPGPWVGGLERDGVRHVALVSSTRGMDLLADLRAARDLWCILRRLRVDVLHTHNPKPGLYGRAVGRLAGVPIVVNTVHGYYASDTDRLLKRTAVYLLEAVASRFSDAELFQNPEDLAVARRWRIARPKRSLLLGNGIDLVRFDPSRFSAQQRADVRASLGVRPDQILVGTVGRLVAEKGYRELFTAAAALDTRFAVLVIGPADAEKADELSAAEIRRAKNDGVQFLGMRDDVDELYAAMDVFTLPSHREGFPRAAMEAAAMGLPIVASDIRGCRQVVAHEVNGLLVPPRDAGALGAAIQRLGRDPELRKRMGAAGRERAREQFDEQSVVRTVLQTYRGIARRRDLDLGPLND